jgi:quinol monooxygenase YgiN
VAQLVAQTTCNRQVVGSIPTAGSDKSCSEVTSEQRKDVMSDLNVVAILEAKPGSETEVQAALEALVTPTRSEPGCISYDLYVSESTPGTFVTIEKWRTQDDLDGHMDTPHIHEALTVAGDHLTGAPRIHSLRPL